jgi:hypothetical protein
MTSIIGLLSGMGKDNDETTGGAAPPFSSPLPQPQMAPLQLEAGF